MCSLGGYLESVFGWFLGIKVLGGIVFSFYRGLDGFGWEDNRVIGRSCGSGFFVGVYYCGYGIGYFFVF